MEPLSIALFVAALGSIACSLILATRVWIFEGKKAISSNADIEAGKVPGIQLAVRTTPILTRPYEPKLTDTAFEIHVLREYPESIPVPDRVGVASAGPSASVSHDSPPHLQLSLHTDDEDRETMFRPSAYMKTMQSRTPSFASVASMEDKLDAEDYTAFSESFRNHVSDDPTLGHKTRSFMNGLAQLYAEHYENTSRKKRLSGSNRSTLSVDSLDWQGQLEAARS